MAEATGLRNNALPYPIYAQPFGITFPMLDADGDLVTGATTPDAEVSKNGDTFTDCTNESTEIATTSGVYYLLLTATEMTADVVTVIAKSATAGMKTTVITLYPRKLVTIRSGTAAGGAAGSITLDSGASAVDDFYNGCVVAGVLDSTNEVRVITDYTGSTKVAAVTPNWNTTPDSDDTFIVYLPEGIQKPSVNVTHWNELATVALPLIPTTAGRTLTIEADGVAHADLKEWLGVAPLALASQYVQVDLIRLGGDAQSATDLKDFADAGYDPATNKVEGVKLADTLTTYTGNTVQTGDSYAIVNSGTFGNAAIKTQTAAIETDTAEIGAAGAGLTNINLPNQTMDIVGNITGNLSGSVGSVTGAVGSVTAGVTLAASAVQAIWDALTSALTTAGSIGKLLVDNVNATIGSRSSHTAANVRTEMDSNSTQLAAIVADTNELQTDWADGGRLDLILDARASQSSLSSLITTVGVAGAGLTAADDAVITAIAALNNISTAQVNAEVDTALSDVGLTSTITGRIDAAVSSRATPAQVNTEVLDVLNADTLIDSKTIVQAVQYVSAICAGRVSGAGTGTEVFKGLDESTTRVTVTVDGSGNRSDIVYG